MIKLILIISFITFPSFAQSQLDELNIFLGKWELVDNNFVLFEEWTKVNETTFEGLSYSAENEEKIISEKLHILKLDNHIVYIAQPGNNLPTLFNLIYSENNKFIFENKEHDFPQRVIYHFTSDNTLNAYTEGEENGKMKRNKFSFKSIK